MRTAKEMVDFCIKNRYDYSAGDTSEIYPHFEALERSLPANEDVIFAFAAIGVEDRKTLVCGGHLAVALTDKKLIYAKKKLIMGDFVKMISFDFINDITTKGGWLGSKLIIDSPSEYAAFGIGQDNVNAIRNSVLEAIENYRAKKNAPAASPAVSAADELKKFKELLDMGIITQEEFDAKKKQLLGL